MTTQNITYSSPTRPPGQDDDRILRQALFNVTEQRDELLAALTETALNRQDKIDWVKINKLIAKCEAAK